MIKYEVAEDHIKLIETPYAGMIVKYGRVKFEEKGETLSLNFHYDVEDPQNRSLSLEDAGDILVDLIHKGLLTNNIVYTGGVDEDREPDYRESDNE